MANPITTTGTTSDPITTTHQSGESVSQWVKRHNDEVSQSTPSGNTLTTSWTCSTGREDVETTRLTGESDADFLLRHQIAYMLAMIECPPVP